MFKADISVWWAFLFGDSGTQVPATSWLSQPPFSKLDLQDARLCLATAEEEREREHRRGFTGSPGSDMHQSAHFPLVRTQSLGHTEPPGRCSLAVEKEEEEKFGASEPGFATDISWRE